MSNYVVREHAADYVEAEAFRRRRPRRDLYRAAVFACRTPLLTSLSSREAVVLSVGNVAELSPLSIAARAAFRARLALVRRSRLWDRLATFCLCALMVDL